MTLPEVTPAGDTFSGRLLTAVEGEPVSGKEDLDGDGVEDCWRVMAIRGGAYEGHTLTVRPACTGAVATLDTTAPVLELAYALPLGLEWRRRPELLQGAVDMLFGASHQRLLRRVDGVATPVVDGALQWLVDWHQQRVIHESTPMTRIIEYQPRFTPGLPVLPEPQFVVVQDPGLDPSMTVLTPAGVAGIQGSVVGPRALLLFRAALHDKPTPVARCAKWQLYSTGHAIAAYDPEGKSHAWAYVSTSATHRKRATVYRAECQADVVVIEPERGKDRRELLIVAPDLGRVGRIPMANKVYWTLDRAKRQLKVGGGVYSLDDLRETLTIVR